MKLGKNQKKWIKALRSGKFKQTRGYLKNSKGHCCLGVACEIFKKELDLTVSEGVGCTAFNNRRTSLPLEVGIHLSMMGDSLVEGSSKLVELNDDAHYRFKRIADYIEKHPKMFFKESK